MLEPCAIDIGSQLLASAHSSAAISGDCSACGLGPSSTLFYDDAQNPFRLTRIVDGRGIETQLAYDANSQVVSKTEAAETTT